MGDIVRFNREAERVFDAFVKATEPVAGLEALATLAGKSIIEKRETTASFEWVPCDPWNGRVEFVPPVDYRDKRVVWEWIEIVKAPVCEKILEMIPAGEVRLLKVGDTFVVVEHVEMHHCKYGVSQAHLRIRRAQQM